MQVLWRRAIKCGGRAILVVAAMVMMLACNADRADDQSAPVVNDHRSEPALPVPREAESCAELIRQMHHAHDVRFALIDDINDVIVLDDAPPDDASFQRFVSAWVVRDQELSCQFMHSRPTELIPPPPQPTNRPQEMARADGTPALQEVLRNTVEALADYHDEYGTYPSTIGELRYATRLGEPRDGTSVDIVAASSSQACVRAEIASAPYPVYVSVPEHRVALDQC